MPQYIASFNLSGYRAVLSTQTENFKRYIQLKKTFSKDNLYMLFAEPKMDFTQNMAMWYTELEGEIKCLTAYDEIEQQKYLTKLKFKVNLFFEECNKHSETDPEWKNLIDTIDKCFEIPDYSCIYTITQKNGEVIPIITMWGFLYDKYNAESGLIRKILPRSFASLTLKCKYKSGRIADNEKIFIEIPEKTFELVSDNNGIIKVDELIAPSSVLVYQLNKTGKKISEVNINFTSHTVKEIIVTGFYPMRFIVKDTNGLICPNKKFVVDFQNIELEYFSNENGEFIIEDVEIDSKVFISHIDKDKSKQQAIEFTCDKHKDAYNITIQPEIHIPAPERPLIKPPINVLLIDNKKNPIPSQDINFNISNAIVTKTTDNNGKCTVENDMPDKSVFKAELIYKKKKYKRKIKYNQQTSEYIIKLKKRNYWWLLLLLLLLPLLLLIPLKKDVTFLTVEKANKNAVENVLVKFNYTQHSLFCFKNKTFFAKEDRAYEGNTDTQGLITFKEITYNVYHYLFYGSSSTLAVASEKCFNTDTIKPLFRTLKNIPPTLIELNYYETDIDFRAVNASNNELLPGALIEIYYIDNKFITSDTTNVNGSVEFKNIKYCPSLIVVGSCYGYYNDTLRGSPQELENDILKRTLKLKPITRAVTFYVKNLKTKEPLPGATCRLIIDGKTVQETISNTNGAVSLIGEATFENVHIIKNITIHASKTDFHDTSKTNVAKVFMDGNNEFRTLYLRPVDKSTQFKIIDAETKNPIEGAQAVLTSKNGKTKTAYSNVNGNVQFGGLTSDDIISIVASKINYYDNDFTIKDKQFGPLVDGHESGRIIPLKPKMSYSITIFNHNSAYDEIFDLYVNNSLIGRIDHAKDAPDRTTYKVMFNDGDNDILLKFVRSGPKGSSADTGSDIIINPVNKEIRYNGKKINYSFVFNKDHNTFRKK